MRLVWSDKICELGIFGVSYLSVAEFINIVLYIPAMKQKTTMSQKFVYMFCPTHIRHIHVLAFCFHHYVGFVWLKRSFY